MQIHILGQALHQKTTHYIFMNKVVFRMSPENAILINEEACFGRFCDLAIAHKNRIKGTADGGLLLSQNFGQTVQGIHIAAAPALILFGNHINALSTLFGQRLAVHRHSKHGQAGHGGLRISQPIGSTATSDLSIDFAIFETGRSNQILVELHQLFNHINTGNFCGNNRIKEIIHQRQQRKAATIIHGHQLENAITKIVATVINIYECFLYGHNLAINQN